MKPVVRVLQWLLGTFLGLGLITLVAAAIITPLVFNLLWPPPAPRSKHKIRHRLRHQSRHRIPPHPLLNQPRPPHRSQTLKGG